MRALTGELQARFGPDGRAQVRASGALELRGPLTSSKLHYLRNVTAGIFGGDVYRTSLHCTEASTARVESSSATKVYSMPGACATATADLCAEPGSRLVYGPHATILLTGSALRQLTRVRVHDGATVLLAETLVMGRIASGQRFDFASYESSLTVQDACGETRYREAYHLEPGPDLEAAMGGLAVLTTVHALGASAQAEALDDLMAARPFAGWSRLPGDCGIVVKALTDTLSEGATVARDCLALFEALNPVVEESTPAGVGAITSRT
jgi:urease accessory protein UreH